MTSHQAGANRLNFIIGNNTLGDHHQWLFFLETHFLTSNNNHVTKNVSVKSWWEGDGSLAMLAVKKNIPYVGLTFTQTHVPLNARVATCSPIIMLSSCVLVMVQLCQTHFVRRSCCRNVLRSWHLKRCKTQSLLCLAMSFAIWSSRPRNCLQLVCKTNEPNNLNASIEHQWSVVSKQMHLCSIEAILHLNVKQTTRSVLFSLC